MAERGLKCFAKLAEKAGKLLYLIQQKRVSGRTQDKSINKTVHPLPAPIDLAFDKGLASSFIYCTVFLGV